MPTTTLCTAIRPDGRAIEMASAIRSRRSTDQDDVRGLPSASPRAPMATPRRRPAPARRSTVADEDRRPSSRSASTASHLLSGPLGQDPIDAEAPDRFGDVRSSPVTMTTRLIPARRSGAGCARRVAGGSVVDDQRAGLPPSTATKTHDGAVERGPSRTSRPSDGIGAPARQRAFPARRGCRRPCPRCPARAAPPHRSGTRGAP